MDLKNKIHTILSEAEGVLSGERISAELGVSRVSVWKHIKGMAKSGIPIAASSKGYRLISDPDSLNPMEFGAWQDRLHYFQELSSTMDEAAKLALQGCADFTVVVAERQNQGRGRMSRIWVSGDGGLYFTVVARPELPIVLASLVNLAAAVDMATLLRSTYQVQATVKWPNDILVNGLKICGILSQMEIEGDRINHLRIGIGLNVNNNPELEEPSAVSLKTLTGEKMPRREILTAFLKSFTERLANFDAKALIDQWKLYNSTLGQQVTVATISTTYEGKAVDIDENGGLILEMVDGSRKTVVHGDCFYS